MTPGANPAQPGGFQWPPFNQSSIYAEVITQSRHPKLKILGAENALTPSQNLLRTLTGAYKIMQNKVC
jgi:hypothetical protein